MRQRRGYTVIELLLFMGLLGILLLIISDFFIATLQAQTVSRADSRVEQDGTFILARVSYDVSRAQSISMPSLGQTTATLSATISDGGVPTTYQYAVTSQNLMLTSGTVSAQLNSDQTNISNVSFMRIGNSGQSGSAKDTIRVSFTVSAKSTGSSGLQSGTYQTTVSLR